MHHSERASSEPQERANPSGGCLSTAFVIFLLLVLAAVGVFAIWTAYRGVWSPYENRIYPNVYVLDRDLSGLTPQEARARLRALSEEYQSGQLILNDGDHTWTIPWSEAGLRLDLDATVQQAYAAGRDRGWRGFLSAWLGERRDVSLVFAIDSQALRRALERLAPEMEEPPTDATLRVEGGEAVAVPGQPGRALDLDATLEKIATTVRRLGPDYPFTPNFRAVSPRIAEVGPAKERAEEMLSRKVHLKAYGEKDDQTFSWEWTLGREAIANWLRVEENEEGTGFVIRVDEEAVRATLEKKAAEPIEKDWGLPLDEATDRVLAAFEAGGGDVSVEMMPPPRIYVVQPGDRLSIIADKFGMPPGLIAEANPDTDLDHLSVGQELLVPPQEVLTPYDPVPGKEIVISVAEQRLRVYEDGALLYDWPCSTGIESSPTYRGHFQVLDKREQAYASQWDLWMPHFLAIYRAGGDTYNGIHGLPTLSSGRRLWEGALGSPASYGCIILGLEEAETLYSWAEIGVPVIIE